MCSACPEERLLSGGEEVPKDPGDLADAWLKMKGGDSISKPNALSCKRGEREVKGGMSRGRGILAQRSGWEGATVQVFGGGVWVEKGRWLKGNNTERGHDTSKRCETMPRARTRGVGGEVAIGSEEE